MNRQDESTIRMLGEFLPAIVRAVMEAMGRAPARVISPMTEEEKPELIEFVQKHWSTRKGYKNHRFKALAVEVDGPRKIPGTDPEETVYQLHVIPIEVVRKVMAEVKAATQSSLLELPSLTG